MSLVDLFRPEDRMEITFSQFSEIIKQAAQFEIVMNGVNCNVPHRFIREMISGISEEPEKEDPDREVDVTGFKNFLFEKYGREEKPKFIILHEYDSVEGPDGERGFGAYHPETKTIYVAGEVPEPEHTILETIAHEYGHFLQDVDGTGFDEDHADEFMLNAIAEFEEFMAAGQKGE